MLPDALVQRLKKLVREDRRVRHIFEDLAQSQRNFKMSDFYRIKLRLQAGGIMISPEELDELGEKLQAIGLGKYKHRKFPKHSNFAWDYAISDIVASAIPGTRPSPATTPLSSPSEARRGPLMRSNGNALRLLIPLRGSMVALAVPCDFNESDAKQIGDFLRQAAELNAREEL